MVNYNSYVYNYATEPLFDTSPTKSLHYQYPESTFKWIVLIILIHLVVFLGPITKCLLRVCCTLFARPPFEGWKEKNLCFRALKPLKNGQL